MKSVVDQQVLPLTVVMGDFNFDTLKPSSDRTKLLQFFRNAHLEPYLQIPTTNMGTTIDIIFTNITNLNVEIIETYFSYYEAIWLAI